MSYPTLPGLFVVTPFGPVAHVHHVASAKHGASAGLLMSPALQAIVRERLDQLERHGFALDHDAHHSGAELAQGAVAYLSAGLAMELDAQPGAVDAAATLWPWGDLFKPSDYRACLIKAAAMIWAELDRIHCAQELIDAARPLNPGDAA